MKHINAMIVDDEANCTEVLSLLLRDYHSDIRLLATAPSVNTALPLIEAHKAQLDLLFLDIQMAGGDGFALLQQLTDVPFKVIFTTAYDQFAIRAIRFSALDYLLKPIDHTELSQSLDRFRRMKDHPPQANHVREFKQALRERTLFDKIAVTTLSEVKLVPVQRIAYLESNSNYTTIYLDDRKKLVSSRNIGYYEELLRDSDFLRIHNSCLVNLRKINAYVKGKGGAVKLDNGTELEVSSRRKEQLMKVLQLG